MMNIDSNNKYDKWAAQKQNESGKRKRARFVVFAFFIDLIGNPAKPPKKIDYEQ